MHLQTCYMCIFISIYINIYMRAQLIYIYIHDMICRCGEHLRIHIYVDREMYIDSKHIHIYTYINIERERCSNNASAKVHCIYIYIYI